MIGAGDDTECIVMELERRSQAVADEAADDVAATHVLIDVELSRICCDDQGGGVEEQTVQIDAAVCHGVDREIERVGSRPSDLDRVQGAGEDEQAFQQVVAPHDELAARGGILRA
jgi:hypothetical protein